MDSNRDGSLPTLFARLASKTQGSTLSPVTWLLVQLLKLCLLAFSVLIVAKVLPGIRVERYSSAVAFAFFVALMNVIVWGIFGLFTWPFAILTLGIGAFFLNGLVFLLASGFVPGVKISGCFTASLAALAVTIVNAALRWLLGPLSPSGFDF